MVVDQPHQLSDAGILVLHGGEDIATSIYKQYPGSYTYNHLPSNRDKREIALVNKAMSLDIPIVGICRGAQLLTALAGGTLIQDVTGHGMNHTITTIDGEQMEVTSAHHQMCNPTGTNHELLAWSTTNRSKHYMGEFDKQVHMDCEPEVIYYPDMDALAVQPHPEWMSPDSEFVQYLYKLIEEKLL
jgi:gamma-glutamyl-gamma-aminobutyrate hydrolase PuuD